jgi:hypothetical protein
VTAQTIKPWRTKSERGTRGNVPEEAKPSVKLVENIPDLLELQFIDCGSSGGGNWVLSEVVFPFARRLTKQLWRDEAAALAKQ